MYSIEDIFEWMWSVERESWKTDSKSVDELVDELNTIQKELPKWLQQ